MFVLRIQSVDFPDAAVAAVAADEVGTSSGGVTTSRPLSSHPPPSTTTSSILTLELPGANPVAPSRSPRILHTRGVIHLYHSSSSTSTSSSYASAVAATSSSSSGPATPQPASDSHLPLCRGTRLLVLAVPTRVSPEDFVRFCGPHLECAADIRFISKWTARKNIEFGHVNHVCQFCQKQSENSTCSVCQTTGNLWICVICGFVGCGRYQEGHAKQHWKDTQHCYSLDLETQRVWDYVGDSFVHRLNQSKSDAKHAKFKSKSKYSGDECVNCSCNDDSDMGGAMFSSKAETIVDEYNRLLASQLETQREYYEGLLSEAKRNKEHQISEAADKAVSDKLEEMQLKLENLIVEKKKVADMNEKLTRSQDMWRQTLRDIEERERAQLKSKDEMILDLEEQIKDFKFSIKLQKSIEKNDGVKGGTLVPLPTVSDSGGKGKRSSRTSKRRN
ncbi:zinc finger (ubiquitin-hydrolase) domain-containing protein [Zea mays]|uniref:Zinc finger (Ubiquitin-hydrolase) domain-containing protein n=1 Tax=Zea mays TaxID=4577 RepID=A0A1D6DW79_MAIZE|nr:zinc finger (ubiquitin-hydrolase) domain-containing protein [Zea mays]